MPNTNLENELLYLKTKVDTLTNELENIKKTRQLVNKDGIPIDTDVYAEVDTVGIVVLHVLRGCYKVKRIANTNIEQGKEFKSLSAAAEFFSKIQRKSGWVYWRNAEGRTLKDAYKG